MLAKPIPLLGRLFTVFTRFIHLAVIYLGIMALVGVMAVFTLPAAKEHLVVVRNAVMNVLSPQEHLLSHQDLLQILGLTEKSNAPFSLESFRANDQNALAMDEASSLEPMVSVQDGAKPLEVEGERGFFDNFASASSFQIKGVPQDKALALREYLSRKFRVARNVTGALIHVVYEEAEKKQLDPILVLGVIAIESRYNPFAESSVGAQGLMQVMTRVHTDKFAPISNSEYVALNPIANIKVGTQILHDCIKRRGGVDAGLSCYVGATGPNDGGYADKVQAERKRIALESRIPLGINLGQYRW